MPVIERESTMRGDQTTIKYRWNVSAHEFDMLPKPTGQCIRSDRFSANSSVPEWSIAMYPNGDMEESKEYISLYLRLESFTMREITACCRFTIYIRGGYKLEKSQFIHKFDHVSAERGCSKFILSHRLAGNNFYIICELCYNNDLRQAANIIGINSNDRAIDVSTVQEMQVLSDVLLRVGDIDLSAHKVLLAVRSPVFRAMFEHDTIEGQQNVISIVDADVDTIREMLTYVYTGTAPNADKMAGSLLAVADKYDMPGLKRICEQELSEKICEDKFCETLVLADLYHAVKLRETCDAFFRKNANEVIGSTSWSEFKVSHANMVVELMTSVFGEDN